MGNFFHYFLLGIVMNFSIPIQNDSDLKFSDSKSKSDAAAIDFSTFMSKNFLNTATFLLELKKLDQANNYLEAKDHPDKVTEHASDNILFLKDSTNKISFNHLLLDNENQYKLKLLEEKLTFQKVLRNSIIVFVLIILALGYWLMKINKENIQLHKNVLKYLQNEKQLLKEKISFQERALASNTLLLIQKNEILNNLKDNLSALNIPASHPINSKIKQLLQIVKANLDFDSDWMKFRLHFLQVHPDFFEDLRKKHISLSNNDIRLCAYIKMGMGIHETAKLMGVNDNSVQKARYRLKKKLGLKKGDDLDEYLNAI